MVQDEPSQPVQAEKRLHPVWLERVEKWTVVLGTLAAIVGLIYSAAKDRRAIQIEQRAWVGVAQWELDHEPEDGATITVRTTLVNKGATPAYDVVGKSRLSVLPAPILDDDWDSIKGGSPAPLFPEAIGHGFNKSLTIEPAGTTAAYRAGKLKIWITGYITYTDVFGRLHWTAYCGYHTPEQNLQLFNACESGNAMDGEDY